MAFAEKTSVSCERSRAEIEKIGLRMEQALIEAVESILEDEIEIEEDDCRQRVPSPLGGGSVIEGCVSRSVADQTVTIEVDDDALRGWYWDRQSSFSGSVDGCGYSARVITARRRRRILELTLEVTSGDGW